MLINEIYLINGSPLIYLTTGPKKWHLLENDTNSTVYLLAHPMWHFGITSLKTCFKQKKSLKKRGIDHMRISI